MDSLIRMYKWKVVETCKKGIEHQQTRYDEAGTLREAQEAVEILAELLELKWFASHGHEIVHVGYEDFKLIQPYITVGGCDD